MQHKQEFSSSFTVSYHSSKSLSTKINRNISKHYINFQYNWIMNIKYLKKKSTIKIVTVTIKSRGIQATVRSSRTHQYAETCICSSHGHSSHSLYNKYSVSKEKAWIEKWKSLWSRRNPASRTLMLSSSYHCPSYKQQRTSH